MTAPTTALAVLQPAELVRQSHAELIEEFGEQEGADHVFLFSRVTGDPEGCWNFTGHRDKNGYGKLRWKGKGMLAHRVSYMIVNGYLPDDLLVCHKCDNPSCINPQHLFLGTNYDNTMDAVRKGRKFIPDSRGENHGGGKLKEADVREIRRLCASRALPQSHIAKQYGINQSVVCAIHRRKIWKSLP